MISARNCQEVFMSRLIILSLFFLPIFAQAQVWTSQNQWSAQWENQFSKWVSSDWQVDTFSKAQLSNGEKNPFFGLRADCADTVYSMRIIFAYNNKLPLQFKDPTGGNVLITEKMNRWNALPEKDRAREFLKFVFNTFSTRSLPNDTYPIALNNHSLRPGILLLTTNKNHHSWTVKKFLSIGVPHLIFSSVAGAGAGSLLKERTSWPNPEWVFEGNSQVEGHAGFRDWRPIEYINQPVWKTPGYSTEQYHIPLHKWVETIQAKLASRNETPNEKAERILTNICAGIEERVDSIDEASAFLSKKGHQCMPYEEYDLYSTPNRDRRIYDELVVLRKHYQQIIKNQWPLSNENQLRLAKIYPFIEVSSLIESQKMAVSQETTGSYCKILLKNKSIDLAEYKRRAYLGLLSNNPHDGYAYRWGDTKGPSPLAAKCPAWDQWSPQPLDIDSL